MNSSSIIRTTLSGSDIYSLQGGEGVGRIMLRVTQTTRIALVQEYIDFQYFTLPANTILIFDPPNLLATENLFFRLDNTLGTDGILEVLRC